jgi:N utilization substance protein B
MKHARSRAREAALKILYQLDVLGETPDEQRLEELLEGERLREPSRAYARRLAAGCVAAREKLDEAITRALEHWKLARLAAVDRCILRIGLFELLEPGDVPPNVSINEAIELAKKYSTEQSGSFINGILDHVRKEREGGM